VSSRQRSAAAPQAPTFLELGYPQLTINSWVGLSAPRGTPPAVVQKIHAALAAALRDPALLKQLEGEGMVALNAGPEQYTQLVRADTERWGQLVRSLNLRAN
jgi:tripartite-type tricarboxylate transporter receptor subunit TctC